MPRIISSLAILVLLAVSAHAGGKKKAIDRAAVAQLVTQGNLLLRTGKLDAAMKAYQKANKLSHHSCALCYMGMAEIKRRRGDFSGARGQDDRALKVTGENKLLAAQLHMARGVIESEMAKDAKDKNLKKAEADFRAGLQLDPAMISDHFNLGVVLVRENRTAAGVAELKSYLAMPGINPAFAARARRIVANPDRAREPYIPNFSVTTLEGRTITTASLGGKVVLLDFWGTWCPPCRASVPMMAHLHKKYAEKPVEILSVSSDNDEQKLKAFITKHRMDWPESIDLSRQMQRLFQVNEFPTYIVVDGRGVIRFRTEGYGSYTESAIENAINKALKKRRSSSKQAGKS